MTSLNTARRPVAEQPSDILDLPEVSHLVDGLQATREAGRPGYPLSDTLKALPRRSYHTPP